MTLMAFFPPKGNFIIRVLKFGIVENFAVSLESAMLPNQTS